MGCKADEAVNGSGHDTVREAVGAGMAASGRSRKRLATPVTCRDRALHNEPNAADRSQSQCPCGLRPNRALAALRSSAS
ncbi:MAG: hypothetical protein WA635_11690 [Gallionella sp.]